MSNLLVNIRGKELDMLGHIENLFSIRVFRIAAGFQVILTLQDRNEVCPELSALECGEDRNILHFRYDLSNDCSEDHPDTDQVFALPVPFEISEYNWWHKWEKEEYRILFIHDDHMV